MIMIVKNKSNQAIGRFDISPGADLHEADLWEANLHDVNLCEANLYGADLHEADLCWTDLHEANLCRANLYEANLHGANLHKANLRGATLHGANLRGANLWDADLRGADLCDALGKFAIGSFGRHCAIAAGGYIAIGCKRYTYNYWLEHYEEIGRENYISDEIARYGAWIEMVVEWLGGDQE